MTWFTVLLLVAFLALTITCLILGTPDTPQRDANSLKGYIYLSNIAVFMLLQVMLVVGVASAQGRHHRRR